MMKFLQNNKVSILFILAIFILAFILRVYKLGEYPVGFHIDEASLGYNGYSLLMTGKDDNNNFLPLYIDMFGDNRPSGYHYLTIVPIIIFGLSEFATRLPGAFFGGLTVFAFFLLAFSIFKDKRIALVGSFLLAVAPWHFALSRASAEAIVALFFIFAGFALIINSLRYGSIKHLWLGVIVSGISFFFYHTPRVFVPLLFLCLITLTFKIWKNFEKKYRYSLILSFIITAISAMILVFGISGGTGRFSQVNVFNSFEANFQLQKEITDDSKAFAPRILSRVMHNKVTNIGYMYISNYLDYFKGEFLFTKGGLPNWYAVPRIGMLLIIELPFILYGIYVLIRKKDLYSKIPLMWLLVGPVVASMTLDDIPNINRASVMFGMMNLIAAVGAVEFIGIFNKSKRKIAIVCLTFLLIANFSYFLFQYFYSAKASKPWYRNNGFSKMMEVVSKNYNSYDAIFISKFQGGIYPLVLFYLKFDPAEYQAAGSPKTTDYKGFGKIIFVPQDCPFLQKNSNSPIVNKALYIEDGSCPDDKRLKLFKHETINREDGTPAFRIVYE